MKKILLLSIGVFFISCKNETQKIISQQGRLEIIVNQYHNPLEDFDNSNHYKISELNYNGSDIIEIINDPQLPDIILDMYYIKDTSYTIIPSVDFIFNEDHYFLPLSEKTAGMNFKDVVFNNFDKRKEMTDTIMNGKIYKRFSIKNQKELSMFYIHPTDTIIPYSLSKIVDTTYKGRLEIIESFNSQYNVYATIYLNHYNSMNSDALKIFDYNNFLKK